MVVPGYQIVENLAEGAHAAVYRAYHKKSPNRLLVLKVLKATALSESRKIHVRQKVEQ